MRDDAPELSWQPGQTPRAVVLRDHAATRIVQFGTLICMHYRGRPGVEDSIADFVPQRQIIEHYGDLTHLVVFEANKMSRPDNLVKDKITEEVRLLGPRLRCSTMLILGSGFGAAMLRLMISGATLMAGTRNKSQISSTFEEALAYLQAWPGQHESVKRVNVPMIRDALGL
jgi:hypothetical protein